MPAEKEAIYHITLLRHGESAGNKDGLFQGQNEFPLTELGREQARRLGEYWQAEGRQFDAIISSPLKRALETAEIISAVLRVPLFTDPAWMEQDFGALSKTRVDTVYLPTKVVNTTPFEHFGENGESRWQVYSRAIQAVQSLLDRPPARYLVVSHGVMLNLALSCMMGMTPMADAQGARLPHANTGFTTLTYLPSRHQFALLALNQTPHQAIPAPFQHLTPDYRFTFLRHAESEGNANGIWQGQSDFPLSAKGLEQAGSLAAYWSQTGKMFDRVISSPLSRARQTAEIIAGALQLPLEIERIWIEHDNGQHSGLTPEQALARNPPPEYLDLFHPIGKDGESLWDLYLRAGQALQTLMKHPPGNYLVVSHGGTLTMLFYHILGIAPQAADKGPRIRFRNCAFAEVNFIKHGQRWWISAVNERPGFELAE